MTENAYAKINLFLDVLRKRDDGFHDIKTVMQTVSLCDKVDVTATPSEKTNIDISVHNASLPLNKDNLAYRAADMYLNEAGITADVKIVIEKNIPIAAGLAGGSSDAAATLRAMNCIFGKLTMNKLLEIGLRLGSDVPFCLVEGTRLCEGRGEIMSELKTPVAHLVVAIGDDRISTPLAFARLDDEFLSEDGKLQTGGDAAFSLLMSGLDKGEIVYDSLFNAFEFGIDKTAKSVSKIKAEMIFKGALAALMSGSGPSVVGFFADKLSAENAAKHLLSLGYFAAYATTV